jgi:mono/diheme cytochrome c family protein
MVRNVLILMTLIMTAASAAFAGDAKAGQAIFDKSCKGCHGADGTPNPAIVKMMKVDMKDLKSPEVQAMSDDAIKKIVTGGTGKMKPVTTVTGASIDNVVAYVRSLKK